MYIFHKIINSSIAKNLSVLVSGTVLAQLVIIVFQVVLRRLYTPEVFGAFAVYMSIVSIVVSIASLRYEQTVVLPKDNRDGAILLHLSVAVSVIVITVFSLLLFLFSNQFLVLVGLPLKYAKWLTLLPFSVLLFSINQSFNYFFIRLKKFELIGVNKVIRRTAEGITQTSIGYYLQNLGLVIGDILGNITIIVYSIFRLRKLDSVLKLVSVKDMKRLAVKYKSFPIKNSLPSLMNTLSGILPVILVSKFFTSDVTGYFDLARVVLIIPLSLVSSSLSQVLLQRLIELRNTSSSIIKDTLGVFLLLLIVSLLFIVVIKFWGVYLFVNIFGEQWISSGSFANILVYAFAIKFLVSPFNSIFIAFEKIGIFSIWQTLYFLSIISLFFITFDNISVFLQTYMIIEVVLYAIVALLNFRILYKYNQSIGV